MSTFTKLTGAYRSITFALFMSLLLGCSSVKLPELETVEYVDLERFMGPWYVIASIPTIFEKGAHNAIESYALNEDGSIATTFTYRKGSFDGKPGRMEPKAFVVDTTTNAIWAMQFIWPLKADYRITYLADDYSLTVIGREKRDYVWIMARTPEIADSKYQEIVALLYKQGYAIDELKKVPQSWP